jgi:hypothetical protein
MTNHDDVPPDAGIRFASDAIDRVTDAAESYCSHESDRIALVNEPRINVLQTEGKHLTERRSRLAERLGAMTPQGDLRRSKLEGWYYGAVGALLSLAAFAFVLYGFDPFRLGAIGKVFCAGIALVTPFLVDEFLKAWKAESVAKVMVTVAFAAALAGGMFLADVRGDLLAHTVTDASPAVVIDDGGDATPASTSRKPSFYESTAIPLQILTILFTLAIDLGAGIAFHRARTVCATCADEREIITRELAVVDQRLAGVVFELTALQNAPAVFAARFWRDFNRTVATKSVGHVATKGVRLFVLGYTLLWPSCSRAQDRMNLVAALDLSTSEKIVGTQAKSAYARNVDGIAHLLANAPPGAHVTVIGITKDSIADPVPILSAELSLDVGYFGERLATGRVQLVRAWRSRTAHLAPSEHGTDILGAIRVAGELFRKESRFGSRVLAIFSDMRNATPALNLETAQSKLVDAIAAFAAQKQITDLSGVTVYVAGANGGGNDMGHWQAVKGFWEAYFERAGARLAGYSILPSAPALLH